MKRILILSMAVFMIFTLSCKKGATFTEGNYKEKDATNTCYNFTGGIATFYVGPTEKSFGSYVVKSDKLIITTVDSQTIEWKIVDSKNLLSDGSIAFTFMSDEESKTFFEKSESVSSNGDIMKTWYRESPGVLKIQITFSSEGVIYPTYDDNGEIKDFKGTYTISDDSINVKLENDTTIDFKISKDDAGKMILIDTDGNTWWDTDPDKEGA